MSDAIRRFFRDHQATPIGMTPTLPVLSQEDDDDEQIPAVQLDVELDPDHWVHRVVPETPARPDEFPVRFIDGCHAGQPVLCLSVRDKGWPIPLFLAEVGAVALRLEGRRFIREFRTISRVLSFVADPFPWAEVEEFSTAIENNPGLQLRVLPANSPKEKHNPFDYEVMRGLARARAQQEMTTLERLALAVNRDVPTLVDGPLSRVMGEPGDTRPLVVGVVKTQTTPYLHDQGWRTLLGLRPGQRTPVFRLEGRYGETWGGGFPVATWYLKLAGGSRLAPNWGYVRVEVPWGQYMKRGGHESGFVNRLSRWLIDARCRVDSYARMPVSLDPIVRAEEALKPLFTPLPVLVNRLYRQAGLFRGHEL